MDLIEHDGPETFNMEISSGILEFKVHLLVDKYHQSNSEQEKSQLKQNIRRQLAVLMDIRLKHRMKEYENLTKELERIKQGIEAVKQNPDQFINNKLSELLGDHFDPFE